jgi:hypothetical protein
MTGGMNGPAAKQPLILERIVSGGQTGVDRAALDAAICLGVPHGGWCPLGRLAEDGPIPGHYRLRETESAEYPARTEMNVIDSDGTLILYRGRLFGGTELTRRLALKHGKPHFAVDLDAKPAARAATLDWLARARIRVLNVAGPRESSSPGIGQAAFSFLRQLLEQADCL